MANYSTDDDLLEVRQDILSLGVTDWEVQHTQAKEFIDRDLDVRWYRMQAKEMGFSYLIYPFSTVYMLDTTQLKRLSVYKTLELAYLYLEHNFESDPATKKTNRFAQLYSDEFQVLTSAGIGYDWNRSGALDYGENHSRGPRVLRRV